MRRTQPESWTPALWPLPRTGSSNLILRTSSRLAEPTKVILFPYGGFWIARMMASKTDSCTLSSTKFGFIIWTNKTKGRQYFVTKEADLRRVYVFSRKWSNRRRRRGPAKTTKLLISSKWPFRKTKRTILISKIYLKADKKRLTLGDHASQLLSLRILVFRIRLAYLS